MKYSKQVMYRDIRSDIQLELVSNLELLLLDIQTALNKVYKSFDADLLTRVSWQLEEILDMYHNTNILIYINDEAAADLKEFSVPLVGRFLMNQDDGHYYFNATEIFADYQFDLDSLIKDHDLDHYYIGKKLLFLNYLLQCLKNVERIKIVKK